MDLFLKKGNTMNDHTQMTPDVLSAAMTLLAIGSDPKAVQDRLNVINKATADAQQAKADAEKALAATAARTAELDKRERAASDKEVAALAANKRVDGARKELVNMAQDLTRREERLSLFLMREGGLLANFDRGRQPVPDYEKVLEYLRTHGSAGDAHFAKDVPEPVSAAESLLRRRTAESRAHG